MNNTKIDQQIASILLSTNAVKLNPSKPFQWSSGWNSPIYCDNRITLSFPEERTIIKNALCSLVTEEFSNIDAIAGVATAGIAQGALVAEALGLPFLYVRPEPKKHGMQNTIEGRLEKGQRVVLIEDLISTGGSSIKAAQNVINHGGEVLGIVASFTYSFQQATDNFDNAGITFHCLSHYEALIHEALNHKYIEESEVEKLMEWRKSPETWGK